MIEFCKNCNSKQWELLWLRGSYPIQQSVFVLSLFLVFETGSFFIGQSGIKPVFFLPQSLTYQDYSHFPTLLTYNFFFTANGMSLYFHKGVTGFIPRDSGLMYMAKLLWFFIKRHRPYSTMYFCNFIRQRQWELWTDVPLLMRKGAPKQRID